MIELKAELIKKKQEYEEAKKNKQQRQQQRKLEPELNKATTPELPESNTSQDQLKQSREALEAKSRLYRRLESGKLMESDLNVAQRENLLVDFAWKGWNPETEDFDFDDNYSSDSDEFESKRPLKMNQVAELLEKEEQEEDKWIEYEDEFGRTRVAKLSELRQIQKERQEVESHRISSSTAHYDGDAEIRNKGVGFYQFARNEEERQGQMRELRKLREETVEKRMKNLILKEQRRLKLESRLNRYKVRKS